MTHKYPHPHPHPLNLTQQCRCHLPVHRSRHLRFRLLHAKDRTTDCDIHSGDIPSLYLQSSLVLTGPFSLRVVRISALRVCLGFLYVELFTCCDMFRDTCSCGQCCQNMVAFYRRANPQPQWAHQGSLRHLVVERRDIPGFRIGRYEYTSMERRSCTFISTTRV